VVVVARRVVKRMWYENSLGLGTLQISTSVSNSELYSYGYCRAFQFSPLASKSHRRESLRQHTTSTCTCSCHNDKSSFSQRVCVEVGNQRRGTAGRVPSRTATDRRACFNGSVGFRIEPATDCVSPGWLSSRGELLDPTIARRLWTARSDGGVATGADDDDDDDDKDNSNNEDGSV
jgi:hypothetical protein